ncbi:MAG: MFS transporter, partial [Proteobacteria bacterium]|nr:MFS transporter [Pseudomonadota bacterium]
MRRGGNAVTTSAPSSSADSGIESGYAWLRLGVAVLVSTIGGVGLWSVVVTLPTMQAEFGVARGDASLPYTATMVAIMIGGVPMGRLADRVGVVIPVLVGGAALGVGYVLSAFTDGLAQFTLVQALLIGLLGSSATLGPLIADVSHWFERRRGIAVAVVASGNYFAGALWPPIVQHFVETVGWRQTHIGIGLFCVVTLVPLALTLRRRAPAHDVARAAAAAGAASVGLGISPRLLQSLLAIASVLCCLAMAMPQVHLVAYCAGLGYGAARGAEMLSVMLACGVVSRLASGWIADRIGGLGTLLLGSVLQGLALLLYLPFDGLVSLYTISALFGLSQGGILPSYAIIVRDYFPPNEAGARVGIVVATNLAGMALGG